MRPSAKKSLLSLAVATAIGVGVFGAVLVARLSTITLLPAGSDTERMARLLKQQYDEEDLPSNKLANKKLVTWFRRKMVDAANPTVRNNFHLALAFEELFSGDAVAAVADFKTLIETLDDGAVAALNSPFLEEVGYPRKTGLWYYLALSHFRVGEITNCLDHANHNMHSCVFPLQGHGVHKDTSGATQALKIWYQLLEKHHPNSARLRWLLNLAYMAVGKYPNAVPAKYLIPPQRFASEREFPEFKDIAGTTGVAVLRGAGSAVLDDFRNQGVLDLLLSSPRLNEQLYYFKNNGRKGRDFTFVNATKDAGLIGITDGKNLQQGDYDNDGCLDLFLPRGAYKQNNGLNPNSLLRGHCDGTFEDVTVKAGLLRFQPVFTSAWWDYDNDGWLDLIVPNETGPPQDQYVRYPGPYEKRGLELWHNNHDGTFSEVHANVGLDVNGNFKGVTWLDYDNDGLGDLVLAEATGETRLFHNEGPGADQHWRFRDITRAAGLPEALPARTLIPFDYDNDGFEDLLLAWGQANDAISFEDVLASYEGKPVSRHPHVFHNNGNGTFTDVSERLHLARAIPIMGANFGDVDYDGYVDLYFGTGSATLDALVPNRLFWNDHGRRFLDVTTASGTGHLQKGHGVSFGDVDGDGTLDFIAQQGGAYEGDGYWTSLFKNPGFGNHWLQLKVRGRRSNRAGIGARIKIQITENGKTRFIYRTVNSGGSRGSNPLVQHMGVGRATRIDRLEVYWPASKLTTVREHVEVDQWLTLDEP